MPKACGAWTDAISPVDAKNFDLKYDDGVSNLGRLVTFATPVNDCVKQSDGTTNADQWYTGTAIYNVAQPVAKCVITILDKNS